MDSYDKSRVCINYYGIVAFVYMLLYFIGVPSAAFFSPGSPLICWSCLVSYPFHGIALLVGTVFAITSTILSVLMFLGLIFAPAFFLLFIYHLMMQDYSQEQQELEESNQGFDTVYVYG